MLERVEAAADSTMTWNVVPEAKAAIAARLTIAGLLAQCVCSRNPRSLSGLRMT